MRKAGICIIMLFFCAQAIAMDAIVSHTIFYVSDSTQKNVQKPSFEIYWQVNPKTVHFTTTPEKTIIARIKTDIIFTNDAGIIKEDHFILQTVPVLSVNDLMTHSIIDLRRYSLGTGRIKMKFTLTDLADTTSKFTYSDTVTIAPPGEVAYMSGVELLDTILESPAKTPYYRNGHQQVPACTNFLDESKKVLHYYAEIYGTDQVSKVNYPLIRKFTISNKPNDSYYANFIKTDTIVPGKVLPTSGSFRLNTLPSGNYYLNVSLENNTHKSIVFGSQFFQLMNIHPEEEEVVKKQAVVSDTAIENITVLDLSKTFLSKYTTTEVLAILRMLLPLSDPMETQTINGFLKKPDDMYVRYYIYNYFKAVNPKDPGLAWKQYSEKVIEVNKLFTAHGMKGYQTDRGFIYLRYGAPSEKITVENESGTNPYEIWQYNVLTQMNHKDIPDAVFLFFKHDDMTSDFKLLHSNVAGEIQNKGWRSFLYVNGGGNGSDSRAEQYIGTK